MSYYQISRRKIQPCPFCGRTQSLEALRLMKQNLKTLKKRFGDESIVARTYKGAVKDLEQILRGTYKNEHVY